MNADQHELLTEILKALDYNGGRVKDLLLERKTDNLVHAHDHIEAVLLYVSQEIRGGE